MCAKIKKKIPAPKGLICSYSGVLACLYAAKNIKIICPFLESNRFSWSVPTKAHSVYNFSAPLLPCLCWKKLSFYLGNRDAVAGSNEIRPDSHQVDAEVKKPWASHKPYISTAQIRSAFLSSLRKTGINLPLPFELHKMKAKTLYLLCLTFRHRASSI